MSTRGNEVGHTTFAFARRRLHALLSVVVLGAAVAVAPIGAASAGATSTPCPPLRSGTWVGTASSGPSTGPWSANLDFSAGLTGTMISLGGIPTNLAISGTVSCAQIQFGDVSGAIAFSGTIAADGNSMSGTWQLGSGGGTYSGVVQLGGLDMTGYCQGLGYHAPPTLLLGSTVGPNFAFDNWACVADDTTPVPVATSGPAPSMSDACATQYPGVTTYAHPTDPNDAYSWNCYPTSLVTSISGTPPTVTAGSDVQYVVTVTNNELETVSGVQVVDTLPTGTTLVSANGPGPCSGTATVTCSLGTLSPSASATVTLLVQTSSVVPAGGVITDTATASPGANNTASLDTTVVAPSPGTAQGYVPPGGSLGTGGSNPAVLTLPNSGNGAPVTITQQPSGNNFCNGPCNGTASFISDFPGYSDPYQPIDLKLTFADHGFITALKDYALSTIYKVRDNETVGVVVPDCQDNPAWTPREKLAAAIRRAWRAGTQSGIANPAPCVDRRTITKGHGDTYYVTFEILFLSDDGGFSRR